MEINGEKRDEDTSDGQPVHGRADRQQGKEKGGRIRPLSTDHDEQLTSYEAQLDYYTTLIKGHEDWVFAGMYSDEGVTGTSTKRREGFQSMVADALAGKIDLIITKSVSRFARNTVDSLSTIRQLKEHGTEVYFEKENIWTFDSKGEAKSVPAIPSTAERLFFPGRFAAGAAAAGTARRSGTATTSTAE